MRGHKRFLAALALLGLLLAISVSAQERKTPRTPGEWNLVGMGLALQDRWPEAVEAFRQAVRLRPDFVEAHNNLGFALATLGKSPEAIKAYQQAIKIKPDYATAHYNLGFTYEAVGKLPEAVGAFKQATQLSPGWDVAAYQLGYAYLQMGLWKEAAEALHQYVSPEPPVAPEPGGKGGQPGAASDEAALQEGVLVMSLEPEKYGAFANLAYAYQKQGRYADAIAAYQQSIKFKPDFSDVHYSLGETYVLSKNREGALQEYDALKKLDEKLARKLRALIDKASE